MKKQVEQKFPGAPIKGVQKSPYFGLYEVQFDDQLIYTDAKVSYVLVGSIYDATTKQNLTEDRLRKLNRVAWDSLPLDLAIKRVKGNGARKLVVFSDADCPFCARLEKELKGVDDVTDLHVPVPDRPAAPRRGAEVEDHLVRARPAQGLGRLLRVGQAAGQQGRLRDADRDAADARPEAQGQRDADAGLRRRLDRPRRAAEGPDRGRVAQGGRGSRAPPRRRRSSSAAPAPRPRPTAPPCTRSHDGDHRFPEEAVHRHHRVDRRLARHAVVSGSPTRTRRSRTARS